MKRVLSTLTLLVLLALLVIGLSLLVLRSLPLFNLASVEILIEDGKKQIPTALEEQLSSMIGNSLFSMNLSRLKGRFESHPTLSELTLKRKLPSTLRVTVKVSDATAIVVAEKEGNTFLVADDRLYELDPKDVSIWESDVPTIEVPLSYAMILKRHGLDAMFHQVLLLTVSLQEKTTLITRVKYDNNSSNSFGKMVLELSSLNAQIWVREPVGAAQVQAAVALVAKDQEHTLSFLSSASKRYDLYREGLVRR